MPWATIMVRTDYWPSEETRVPYNGKEFILRPRSDKHRDLVTIEYEQKNPRKLSEENTEHLLLVRRFLSRLSWATGERFEEVARTGGSHPWAAIVAENPFPAGSLHNIVDLPAPNDKKIVLALALYREGLSTRNQLYQFLCFFKILNTAKRKKKEIIALVNKTAQKLKDKSYFCKHIRGRLEKNAVGEYLAEKRNQIAHAFTREIIDPEDPSSVETMHEDNALLRAVAEHVISNELGFKRP